MTDNPNKKSLWDKIHIDPAMLLILLALLVYSALVIWSASGQDIGMMERKIGQIAMGLVIMVVMAGGPLGPGTPARTMPVTGATRPLPNRP